MLHISQPAFPCLRIYPKEVIKYVSEDFTAKLKVTSLFPWKVLLNQGHNFFHIFELAFPCIEMYQRP